MKKYSIIILGILFSSCTKQYKAEHLVKNYLDSTLNDNMSYGSVGFSRLYKLKDTIIIFQGKPDTENYHGKYEIMHTYRAKNGFGAIVKTTECFGIDSAMTKATCCFVPQNNNE